MGFFSTSGRNLETGSWSFCHDNFYSSGTLESDTKNLQMAYLTDDESNSISSVKFLLDSRGDQIFENDL